MPTLTIGILTLNEAIRIGRCIDSAKWADQIVVVDSGSTDGTQAIVQEKNAELFEYPDWQGFAVQRNRILQHCTSDYIFFLDADEELTPALSREIQSVVASGSQHVWEVGWEIVAFGKRLTAMSPRDKVRRLFLRDQIVSFEGVVHEHAILKQVETQVSVLNERLPHHSRETVYLSLMKLAQYVQLGASKRAQMGKKGGVWRGVGSALVNFIRMYFGHRGFLCGSQGFVFCLFLSLECFFRYVALEFDQGQLDRMVKR